MSSFKFSEDFTPGVIQAIGPNAKPRTRQVFTALVQHLHDFAREIELTKEEWLLGMQYLNEVGNIFFTSDGKRNEMRRLSDITGLESLLDEIANRNSSQRSEPESSPDQIPTSSAILGPFWSATAPFRENGTSIIQNAHDGIVCLMHGRVLDIDTGRPIENAIIDVWQASSNGKYDVQDPEGQTPNNLRGKFRTDAEGNYKLYCLKPTPYSLPNDGPSWRLLQALDRHSMRPAHIHAIVSADGYKTVVTQLFPKDDPWVETDTVFATKHDLLCDFVPLEGDDQAKVELKYDYILAPTTKQVNGD